MPDPYTFSVQAVASRVWEMKRHTWPVHSENSITSVGAGTAVLSRWPSGDNTTRGYRNTTRGDGDTTRADGDTTRGDGEACRH